MTYRDLHKILLSHGFVDTGGKGDHINYRKKGHPQLVTVRNNQKNRKVPANALADYRRRTGIDFKEAQIEQ